VAIPLHEAKNEELELQKERSQYSDQFLVGAALTQPRMYHKSRFSKSDIFKKET
jgi:hypothetical protein